MIRARAALTRQAQDFFHRHLVGIFRWDDVEIAPPEKNENEPSESWPRNKRGRRIRPDRLEGKYHAEVRMAFGIWDLTIYGPNERPPLGWLTLKGYDTIEGTLDAATWNKFAEHIKENHKEPENVF